VLFPVAFALTNLVAGETCPAALDVDQRVRAILHLSAEQELAEGFIVERREAGLFVELRSADSTVIGQRTLPTTGSCDELAQAAAVVLSAWLSDVHPDFAGALPAPEPHEAEPEPVPIPAPASPPVAKPRIPASSPRAATPVSLALPHHWELSLGLGATAADGKLALAGMASLGYMPLDDGLGFSALLLADGPRREPLGAGSVAWRRWPFGLGASFRVTSSSLLGDLTVGPALAWLHLSGSDFSPNRTKQGVTWASFAQLRVASRGRAGVFGAAVGQYYFGRSTAYTTSAEYELPRISFCFAMGANLSP
jgi:hypothetical protein